MLSRCVITNPARSNLNVPHCPPNILSLLSIFTFWFEVQLLHCHIHCVYQKWSPNFTHSVPVYENNNPAKWTIELLLQFCPNWPDVVPYHAYSNGIFVWEIMSLLPAMPSLVLPCSWQFLIHRRSTAVPLDIIRWKSILTLQHAWN